MTMHAAMFALFKQINPRAVYVYLLLNTPINWNVDSEYGLLTML